jgi:hypoxanthine phosphoribosyltransferase
MTKDLYISWTEYHEKIEQLALKIYRSQWQFDSIICLAKGGLRIGDILCRIFNLPLAILAVASYSGLHKQTRGKINIAEHLTAIEKDLGKKILLVDDLVDSGISLQETSKWLQEKYPDSIEEIRSAVIWYKQSSIVVPDYYIDYLPHNPWIHQPFEIYENFNLE